MAVKCELCSYQAKTPQGLAGHKQFKHQLADRFPRPSELAQRVETLESREAELAENIKLLEKTKAELEQAIPKLREEVAKSTQQKAELSSTIGQLEELAKVRGEEFVLKFRQELMALGWYPVNGMDAGQLLLLAGVKWATRR